MCGIVGYIGQHSAAGILLDGLQTLEYRGYDSAGVAVIDHGSMRVIKRAGRVHELRTAVETEELAGTVGIGHTRWATHGPVTDTNAHPHVSNAGRIAVVHNGQINNFVVLRQDLAQAGHVFRSETDTEVIAHLIEHCARGDVDTLTAIQHAATLLDGTFALAVIDVDDPDRVFGVTMGSPLFFGQANHGLFIASDHIAFRLATDQSITLHDREIVVLNRDGTHQIVDFDNQSIHREMATLEYELDELSRGSFSTFMLKEIHEQPEVIRRVLAGRVTPDGLIRLGSLERWPDLDRFLHDPAQLKEIVILACGTSLYAGQAIVRFYQELGLHARAIDAVVYTSSLVHFNPQTLVIGISQSGTTADLLEAMDRAKREKAVTFALCNRAGSALTTYGPGMHLMAGHEQGVASTKVYTAEVVCGGLLGLAIGYPRLVNSRVVQAYADEARDLSGMVERILSGADALRKLGATLREQHTMLYLGSGYGLAAAMEGALKMMEIAYIQSVAMPPASMKHGPIAMIPDSTVVAICLPDHQVPDLYERTLNNISQVLSRGARVIAVVEEDDQRVAELNRGGRQVDALIRVPAVRSGLWSAITAVIPLQLLAHGAAEARGKKIDLPRNLAKSVTVK